MRRRAERKFAQLEARRKQLAPRTFAGDDKARVELEGVELEHDEIARSVRVAQSAAPELARMVKESKEKLAQARRDVHKARASRIRLEIEALNPKRDALADELIQILKEQSSLRGEYLEVLNRFDQDAANALATDRGGPQRKWIRQRFSKWM